MATVPPRPERRRPGPGSRERPVNGRLYRGPWLLVGLPRLVAASSVARPTPLPRSFLPAFDGGATKQLAKDLVNQYPKRYPGSLPAADWVRSQLELYGLPVRTERFSAVIPGRGRVLMQNLVAEAVGRSPRTIVVMAHRDNDGTGLGANDNASGTAMLIQLARAYATPPGVPATSLHPNHTIVFLSSDGGTFGGLGAAWFAAHSPLRHDVAAGINLDAVGGNGRIRLQFAQGTSSSIYLGSRLIRGWAVELVLIACLLPFLAAAVDLFARCRRRRIPLAPALRGYRSRLGFWIWVVGLFELFGLLGAWPDGAPRPISPHSPVAHDWPARALLGLAVLTLLGWFVSRERLIPRRSEEHTSELQSQSNVVCRLLLENKNRLLLNPGDQLLRLYDLVRIHTHTNSTLSDQKLDDLGIVRRRLATDRRGNAMLATDPNHMTHRPQHRKITLIIDLLNRRVVPVDPENQHRQIVRPERDPVNPLQDKLVDQQHSRRNLAHYPQLEIRTTLQPLLFHNLLRIPEILQRPDERQHHMDIRQLELLPHLPNRPTLQPKHIRLLHIPERAPETQQRIRPNVPRIPLILLTTRQSEKIVRLEI